MLAADRSLHSSAEFNNEVGAECLPPGRADEHRGRVQDYRGIPRSS